MADEWDWVARLVYFVEAENKKLCCRGETARSNAFLSSVIRSFISFISRNYGTGIESHILHSRLHMI